RGDRLFQVGLSRVAVPGRDVVLGGLLRTRLGLLEPLEGVLHALGRGGLGPFGVHDRYLVLPRDGPVIRLAGGEATGPVLVRRPVGDFALARVGGDERDDGPLDRLAVQREGPGPPELPPAPYPHPPHP